MGLSSSWWRRGSHSGPGLAPPVLADFLRQQEMPLNLLRLALALLVIVSHTYPVGGYGSDPAWPTVRPSTTVGGFAVGAFFALSGMLVTMSGQRGSAARFVRSRFLRLFPAYVVVLVLSAALLAPLMYMATHGTLVGYFTVQPGGPVTYLAKNLLFPVGLQYGIDDVFAATTPYGLQVGASVINGSLWSLPIEVRCYVVALVVVAVGKSVGVARTAATALTLIGGLLVIGHLSPNVAAYLTPDWLPPEMTELLFVFLCGSVVGSMAFRLRVTWSLVAATVAVFAVATVMGGVWFRTVGLGSLALLLPMVAAVLPRHRLRFFHNDLSYGTYIWAFPVQQTLAFLGLTALPLAFGATATALTLILAGLSWKLVEQPALRLKDRRWSGGASGIAPGPGRSAG